MSIPDMARAVRGGAGAGPGLQAGIFAATTELLEQEERVSQVQRGRH